MHQDRLRFSHPAVIEPVRIQASAASGRIFAYGAQLGSWSPVGHQDGLFLNPTAVRRPGTAIRGGIPVIFPWFGPGRRAGMSPSHGFARTALWHLVSGEAGVESGVEVSRLSY